MIEHNRIYEWAYLENSGSKEMNVEGSVEATITFKWEPPEGEMWNLERLFFFLLDDGDMMHNKFAALESKLTNGLKLVMRVNCCDSKVTDVVDNTDLLMLFPIDRNIGNGSAGFLNEDDYYAGSLVFGEGIQMEGRSEDSDLVKMVVKDDLREVTRMRMAVLCWKIA